MATAFGHEAALLLEQGCHLNPAGLSPTIPVVTPNRHFFSTISTPRKNTTKKISWSVRPSGACQLILSTMMIATQNTAVASTAARKACQRGLNITRRAPVLDWPAAASHVQAAGR